MKRTELPLLVLLCLLAIAGGVLAWRFPGPRLSGLVIGIGSVDLAFKGGISVVLGLLVTRGYPWRIRPLLAVLIGGAWFVMAAGAVHIPSDVAANPFPLAGFLLACAVAVDLVWRRLNGNRQHDTGSTRNDTVATK